jgi:hypothetical protein
MNKRFAPNGYVWVCMACGKIHTDKYGMEGEGTVGWDESCMLNSSLFRRDQLVFSEDSGRVVEIKE